MKLALGTVQFGLDYGVSNPFGKTSEKEIVKILSLAKDNKISFVDTAYGYGDAHSIIGRNTSVSDYWKIVTKLTVTDNSFITSEDVLTFRNMFNKSIHDMGRSSIYALLLHSEEDLFKPGSELIFQELRRLKLSGLINKIGVSLYDVNLVDKILKLNIIDIIQIPINIFDQRLVLSGKLVRLKNKGIEIHARSVFLQGLLLQDIQDINSYFLPIKDKIISLSNEANIRNLTIMQLLLGFIQGISLIDVAVVGVNNTVQLEKIIASLGVIIQPKELSYLSVDEERFINPSKWEIDEN
jgi:aryl-alcohol dehydrogenase-like predicted oxidoreductase